MPYYEGDLIRVSIKFLVNNIAADPTTVTLKWQAPGNIAVTWVFNTNFQVVKDSAGNYHADLDVNISGMWQFRWIGTGIAQGTGQSSFEVLAANIK